MLVCHDNNSSFGFTTLQALALAKFNIVRSNCPIIIHLHLDMYDTLYAVIYTGLFSSGWEHSGQE